MKKIGVTASLALMLVCAGCATQHTAPSKSAAPGDASMQPPPPGNPVTRIYMHNVQLHRGSDLTLRVQWMRGYLKQTRAKQVASLDDDSSFDIQLQDGVVAVGLSELAAFAQKAGISNSAVSGIEFEPRGQQLVIKARYRHILPIRITGTLSPAAHAQVRVHVSKIDVLDLPVGGLLRALHVKTADLIDFKHSQGIRVTGDDILVDGSQILPPPHISGDLTGVSLSGGDLVETFGNAGPEVLQREEWRNYLSLKGGQLGFGKLLMIDTDMMMIDTSADQWFDLDLDHYQAQMVYGYIRMTPQAGLQVFMPDLATIQKNLGPRFNLDWIRHRSQSPPADVMPH